MLYDEPVFRPPSEASSLILQVTIGCSHNACTFCDMYKGKHFRIKEWEAIQKDIEEASQYAIHTKRIFLADGNALSMPTEIIFHLLNLLYTTFPQLQRVTAYAGPKDILNKNFDELKQLRKAGLTILYMGIESGHDPILQSVHKGVSSQEMQEAGQKALETGFALSVTIINGLGGKEKSQEHAVDTAKLLSAINPTYIGALTLMPMPGTILYQQIQKGQMSLLKPLETLQEIKWMLDEMQVNNSMFRCNHASNYLPLRGILNKDKDILCNLLANVLNNPQDYSMKPDYLRGL